jgi:hypothetical protein
MSFNEGLDKYVIYVKLCVVGESVEDALDYAQEALDASDLLDQDGVVSIELVDDIDTIESEEDYDADFGESSYE